jgi:hypothetical protein
VWHSLEEMRTSASLESLVAQAEPLDAVLDEFQASSITCPPSPYSYWVNTSYAEFPQTTQGRLVVALSDGSYGMCSGSLIRPGVVLTAGHCIYPGEWITAALFVPGYLNGEAPLGQYYAANVVAPAAWVPGLDWRYDYGFVILRQRPGDTLGWLGVAWNQSAEGRTWRQMGYPIEDPFDGSVLVVNESALGGRAGAYGPPAPMLVGSVLNKGASGGPWLLIEEGQHYANGVNSALVPSCPGAVMSPYFDSTFGDIYWAIREAVE